MIHETGTNIFILSPGSGYAKKNKTATLHLITAALDAHCFISSLTH